MKKGVTACLAAMLAVSSGMPTILAAQQVTESIVVANTSTEDEEQQRVVVETLTLQDAIKYGMESDFSLMEIEYAIEELKITEDQVDENFDDVDDTLDSLYNIYDVLELQSAAEATADSTTVESAIVNFDKKISSLVEILEILSDEEVQKIMNATNDAGDPAAVLNGLLVNVENFMEEYKVLEQSTSQKLATLTEQIYSMTQTYESLSATLDQLELTINSTYNSRSKMFQAIPLSITSTYFSILKSEEQLALMQVNLANEEKDARAAQVKYEIGMISKKDFDKATRDLSDVEKNIVLLEKSLKNLKVTFALTIGIAYQDNYKLVKPDLGEVTLLKQGKPTAELIEKNFDMVTAKRNLKIAQYQSEYIEDKDNATREEEKQAALDIEQAQLGIDSLVVSLEKSIQTTFFQAEAQYKTVQDAAQALQVAKDEVADIQVYYDLGMISKLQFEASSLLVQQAEMAYTNALYDYYLLQQKVEAMYEGVII